MKNRKVSEKLILSFLIVIVLSVIVGVAGVVAILINRDSLYDMYNDQLLPLEELAEVKETLVSMRMYVREMIIASGDGDQNGVETSFARIAAYIPEMEHAMNLYEASLYKGSDAEKLFLEARRLYENDLTPVVLSIYAAAQTEDAARLQSLLVDCKRISAVITSNLDECMAIKIESAEESKLQAINLSMVLLWVIVGVLIVVIAVSMFLAFYISGLIARPLKVLTAFMKKAGTTGDITITPEDAQIIGEYAQIKDEIGQTISGASAFVHHVTNVANDLEVIASGDLTVEVEQLSASDTMAISMVKMVKSLNEMFGEINSSTSQVSSGSKQIADSAQALASGSTQQAASVEELSASIADIADKTKLNADMADKAANLANAIKDKAETGSRQMDDMVSAVNEINQASQSIGKVIKVIDDIAFQTNILALNAAVEAARAGQHGKGFAVVAEEVRNLAAKSAEAAKDTGGLIANSIEKAELGARIAQDTASSLAEIVTGINESSQIVAEIASSSEEQSSAVEQINIGLNQVSTVIQQNSATAEESAAASEEMSGQSNMLEDLVAQFKLK
ncbi:MAG: methyl-accepting chemotaxis protein [Oscillospiraceae bacterium]|nr:methyl-accepting chemotaxis protein [Oscillospiraceae bacterium]